MTTIYLIRHAEAEGNLYRRLHGQYDSMVTPNGHKQIDALNRLREDAEKRYLERAAALGLMPECAG